jgi:hypothetical protein
MSAEDAVPKRENFFIGDDNRHISISLSRKVYELLLRLVPREEIKSFLDALMAKIIIENEKEVRQVIYLHHQTMGTDPAEDLARLDRVLASKFEKKWF